MLKVNHIQQNGKLPARAINGHRPPRTARNGP